MAKPVHKIPKMLAETKLLKVMFESSMETSLPPVKKRKMDKGIEKKAAIPIEQQANSNDEFSLTVLTQFAEKAYNIEENTISSEKNKLLSTIDW